MPKYLKILHNLFPSSASRNFTTSSLSRVDYTHTVIGGGVVGLAITRQLAAHHDTSTILLERNSAVGMETSSRNSEVIHAGLYYGADSLKTRLCILGKQRLYALCSKYSIPHAKIGKWIVAQTNEQLEELDKVHKFSREIESAFTEFVSQEQAARLEPLIHAGAGILNSPTTGIIDSHAYMQFLLGDLSEKGADVALFNQVTKIQSLGKDGSRGWLITTCDTRSGEFSTISSETIINSAGLGATEINNMILPPAQHRQQYYAKGNYFSCTSSRPLASRLIYPAPEPGLAGLGTHLTLDMAGRVRFGPDVEWVDSPNDLAVNTSRLPETIEQIRRFIPTIDINTIVPDYAGIRPKLAYGAAVGFCPKFKDFYLMMEPEVKGFVNLLGIESPGLTSSLAIAEMVDNILYG
ncbi:hypothetical protein K3495_g9934 [Podosphaera aphanis]|nr:hypothetical protein K3495_g9934 [Podosphaera aphanis]